MDTPNLMNHEQHVNHYLHQYYAGAITFLELRRKVNALWRKA